MCINIEDFRIVFFFNTINLFLSFSDLILNFVMKMEPNAITLISVLLISNDSGGFFFS